MGSGRRIAATDCVNSGSGVERRGAGGGDGGRESGTVLFCEKILDLSFGVQADEDRRHALVVELKKYLASGVENIVQANEGRAKWPRRREKVRERNPTVDGGVRVR